VASFFSHPAFPVALLLSRKEKFLSRKLFFLCVILTCLPDADVIAFRFGIPYSSQWGHRGFTHSIAFSLLTALVCMLFSEKLGNSKKTVFFAAFLSVLSHSIFDAFTNGGLGVAFLWPMDHSRYFFPWHPMEVSPIGVKGFLSRRGLVVLLSEFIWIWIPCLSLSVLLRKVFTRHT
jgi:inner membrane protein